MPNAMLLPFPYAISQNQYAVTSPSTKAPVIHKNGLFIFSSSYCFSAMYFSSRSNGEVREMELR